MTDLPHPFDARARLEQLENDIVDLDAILERETEVRSTAEDRSAKVTGHAEPPD